jgi:glycosyltransferase involved in cell wall biosynthesis
VESSTIVRVLHVIKAKGIGGAERHLLTLLPGLRDAGVEVGLVVIATDQAGKFIDPMRSAGIRVHVLDAPRFSVSMGLIRRLENEIKAFRPDLVHTHLIHADLHGQIAARLSRVRGVSSIHSVHDFYRRHPYRYGAKLAGRLAERTIAISRYAADFVVGARIVPRDRARVVSYGIDADGWALPAEQRRRARRGFGIVDDDVVVGMAARLIPGKGHEDVIRALGITARSGHPIRLLIAGEGPARPFLESDSRAVPGERIRFLGFVDDVVRFMNAVDIVCFPTRPSLGEGFGLAALEAMAAARPVVASSVASLPEIVQDGRTGLLVPPERPDALADAFVRLASDPAERRRMGRAARDRAASTFSLDSMVRGTLGVYREAIDARTAGSAS